MCLVLKVQTEQKEQLGSLRLQNSIQSIIYVLSVAIITPVKEEIYFEVFYIDFRKEI